MSSSSYATIAALTVLENPRKASARTTVFTCNLFIGSPSLEKITGSVRYYSEEDGEYPDVGVYHAIIAVAKMEKGIKVFTDDEEEQGEFSFVGDIKSFFLIGEEGSTAVENIDLARRAYVNICGAVTRSDASSATFTLDAEQYTSAFAEQAKKASEDSSIVALKSVLPVIGYIPDSPRYKNKKPVPWVKKYVSFGGYLSGITASLEGETLFERFRVEVDNIAFLGTYTPTASTPAPNGGSGSGGSSNKKPRFSYSKPSTRGKRRMDDDEDNNGSAGGAGNASGSSPSPFTATRGGATA
ncbi:hypothetical protein C8R43DRAFT_946832 [Mycena crocata]|nr:hypothetical protein C8R43DRAFT_946832 [Mycena crocata]